MKISLKTIVQYLHILAIKLVQIHINIIFNKFGIEIELENILAQRQIFNHWTIKFYYKYSITFKKLFFIHNVDVYE